MQDPSPVRNAPPQCGCPQRLAQPRAQQQRTLCCMLRNTTLLWSFSLGRHHGAQAVRAGQVDWSGAGAGHQGEGALPLQLKSVIPVSLMVLAPQSPYMACWHHLLNLRHMHHNMSVSILTINTGVSSIILLARGPHSLHLETLSVNKPDDQVFPNTV